MENNKPKIEDDFKNFFNVVKNHFKEQYQFLDFEFLKDYDSRTHLGGFLLYNIFYIMVFAFWLLNLILGGQIASPEFSIIGFTKDYFLTGEFITFDAWRIHILINVILFFKCLDFGETERQRQEKISHKFPTKEELLAKYRKRGWKSPIKQMEKKIIKTEYHQLPKHPDGFFDWKYKKVYYDNGEVWIVGFWF